MASHKLILTLAVLFFILMMGLSFFLVERAQSSSLYDSPHDKIAHAVVGAVCTSLSVYVLSHYKDQFAGRWRLIVAPLVCLTINTIKEATDAKFSTADWLAGSLGVGLATLTITIAFD